jgi:hypothetical protein
MFKAFFGVATLVMSGIVVIAAIDLHHGNAAAINGIIGAGIWAAICAGFTVYSWWIGE